MRVYLLNDRTKPRIVYLGTMSNDNCVILQPQEAKILEITEAPEGAIPWVKDWDGCTLVSWIGKEGIENGKVETISRTGY